MITSQGLDASLFSLESERMVVTIMFGLGFATVLTLIVVPGLYAIFFKVTSPTS